MRFAFQPSADPLHLLPSGELANAWTERAGDGADWTEDMTTLCRLRRRTLTLRMLTLAFLCLCAFVLKAPSVQPIVVGIASLIVLVAAVDHALTANLMRLSGERRHEPMPGADVSRMSARWDGLMCVSSSLYAGLCLVLWLGASEPGAEVAAKMCALLFICAAMLGHAVVPDVGRRHYLLLTLPQFAGLVVMPVWDLLAVGKRSDFALVELLACLVLIGFVTAVRHAARTLSLQTRAAHMHAEEKARLADAANRDKSQFIALMSHEIRTPLNAMFGSTELLRRTPLNLEQRSHIATLTEGGKVLLELLNDLLDYSKMEAGRLEIESLPVPLDALAGSAESMWRTRIEEKGLGFRIERTGVALSGFEGDPTRIRQVLFNLLSNAAKFTETGEVVLRIDVRSGAGVERADIRFDVADTGPGLSAETAAHVFEPFRQADSSIARRHGGTGLGLPICRQLAELMGGRIEVTSTPGAGATFSLVLPDRRMVHVATDLAEAEDADAVPSRPLVVLVADDHAVNRRVLGALLQPLGHDIVMAADGAEAVELAALVQPDVILMDIQMPKMDGLEATRQLRALEPPLAGVPIIALTANSGPEDRRAALVAGMTDFVTKPIDPRALFVALARAAASDPASSTTPPLAAVQHQTTID